VSRGTWRGIAADRLSRAAQATVLRTLPACRAGRLDERCRYRCEGLSGLTGGLGRGFGGADQLLRVCPGHVVETTFVGTSRPVARGTGSQRARWRSKQRDAASGGRGVQHASDFVEVPIDSLLEHDVRRGWVGAETIELPAGR